ncbi:hypothetical protein HHL16_12310 [Pseudoflavitalea sp. G-6-1-2]|uniref:hypothetical protein n=1 Tax=Pseudoflavitalea sp. G-6-1-2 TaxID=2728841 RepID=UPI00146CFEB5|nr:hypothetical protein [Pseudoflavitalea sp. G-6-1-2]NML21665.1 hypothetical protein [Pseudoflavitalea sp. G-6-1-2]
MPAIKNLYTFLQNIRKKSVNIDVEVLDTESLDPLFSGGADETKELDEQRKEKFKTTYGIALSKEQIDYFHLTSCILRWNRSEQEPKEGLLSGGFAFNGISNLFKFNNPFWQESADKFKETAKGKLPDEALLQQLRWIESPTPKNSGIYTPQFGCVILEKEKFPNQFYFYDSGLVYPLPFQSYEEYIDALTDSAAVRCWQYFYVDPALIVQKNKGLSYIGWSLHVTSHLEEGIRDLTVNKNIQSDRLDLIDEYLHRCVQLLPKSFPFLDFSHHKKHYEAFSKLYEKSKQ